MDLNLRDKVAVITGGTVGIGLAVAEGLAAEGVNLVLVGRNGQRGDDEAARIADKFGIIATAVAADVATAAGCDAVIAGTARAFGGANILINNAGTGSNETIAEADDAKWQYYWDLHVMAAVRLARGLVPGMKRRGGGVVLHNASICAVQPLWYEPIYNTTKAALMMFSKTLANEVVGDNIRVNTINPGLVLTPDWIKTAKEIAGEDGWQAHLQGVADEATAAGCDAVIAGTARAFGGADILINNAGTGSNETIAEADDARWQYYWDLHVMAAVRLARGLVPGMKTRGGGVVLHNASICAVRPLWYEPIYNTTKAALMMFSKTLANEVVGDNIRVNTVNPGLVLTPDWIKTAKQIAGEDGWQAHLQGVADEAGGMKRFATPEELANFFVFMCSDKASYSTGSTYFVDGGWLKTV